MILRRMGADMTAKSSAALSKTWSGFSSAGCRFWGEEIGMRFSGGGRTSKTESIILRYILFSHYYAE
jgi:hypothetical protein